MERLRGERGVSPISTRLRLRRRVSSCERDSLLSLKRAVARSRIKSRAETYRGGISSPPKRCRSVAAVGYRCRAECRASHAEREAYDPSTSDSSLVPAVIIYSSSEPTRARTSEWSLVSDASRRDRRGFSRRSLKSPSRKGSATGSRDCFLREAGNGSCGA